VRYTPDYKISLEKSCELLEDADISEIPVDLNKIIEAFSNEISVKTYSDFMNEDNFSLEEVIDFFDSNLGACCYRPDTNQYIIYYNDVDKTDNWIRFTIAHELGHIFIGHHQMYGEEILSRKGLGKYKYDELEKEANNFARNLLTPAPLAEQVVIFEKKKNPFTISNLFEITNNAAEVRLNYILRDLKDFSYTMKNFFKLRFKPLRIYCSECGTEYEDNASFCVNCGSNTQSFGFNYKPLLDNKSPKKYDVCVICGHKNFNREAKFCPICGVSISNLCSNNKEHKVKLTDYYCSECGSPTTMKQYIKESNEERGERDMLYEDGVDFDESTMKVKICPRCGNEEFSENAEFCRICGTNLYNDCEGIHTQDFNGYEEVGEIHHNPSNARYCETCGAKTRFFIDGILCDHSEYNKKYTNESNSGFNFPVDDEIPF
jgi:Zn-dependent peptidase ImmA (M78 family)/ribosomal protein L37E